MNFRSSSKIQQVIKRTRKQQNSIRIHGQQQQDNRKQQMGEIWKQVRKYEKQN